MSPNPFKDYEVVNIATNRESLEFALSRLQTQVVLLEQSMSATNLSDDLRTVCTALSNVEKTLKTTTLTDSVISALANELRAANLSLRMLRAGVSINPDAIPPSGFRPDMVVELFAGLRARINNTTDDEAGVTVFDNPTNYPAN